MPGSCRNGNKTSGSKNAERIAQVAEKLYGSQEGILLIVSWYKGTRLNNNVKTCNWPTNVAPLT